MIFWVIKILDFNPIFYDLKQVLKTCLTQKSDSFLVNKLFDKLQFQVSIQVDSTYQI